MHTCTHIHVPPVHTCPCTMHNTCTHAHPHTRTACTYTNTSTNPTQVHMHISPRLTPVRHDPCTSTYTSAHTPTRVCSPSLSCGACMYHAMLADATVLYMWLRSVARTHRHTHTWCSTFYVSVSVSVVLPCVVSSLLLHCDAVQSAEWRNSCHVSDMTDMLNVARHVEHGCDASDSADCCALA